MEYCPLPPPRIVELFEQISREVIEAYFLSREVSPYIEGRLKENEARYPELKNRPNIMLDSWEWKSQSIHDENQKVQASLPTYSHENFWNAAYDYNPWGPEMPVVVEDLDKFMSMAKPPIPLGTLKGGAVLSLQAAFNTLPEIDHDFTPPCPYAPTDSVAIKYPDGHPSAETSPLSFSSLSLKTAPPKTLAIKVGEDDKLRRVCALGWVARKDGNQWRRSGHVLVMDMDDKKIRHRQPWFILATSWPGYHDGTIDGDFYDYAAKSVLRSDDQAAGVLPGGKNRTPICMISPLDPKKSEKPVLKQFGEDFEFEVVRFGGPRNVVPSRFGPALVEVMTWYWDPKLKQEVCYMGKGQEYMRFDRAKQEYSFPDFSDALVQGQEGLFGTITNEPITRESRMALSTFSMDQPPQQRRVTSTAEDF